jgi:hypothetical protein
MMSDIYDTDYYPGVFLIVNLIKCFILGVVCYRTSLQLIDKMKTALAARAKLSIL